MTTQSAGMDHLFRIAEQLAHDFSLFPRSPDLPVHRKLDGLLTEDVIQEKLAYLEELDVDAYARATVAPTDDPSRPGAMSVLRQLPWPMIEEIQMGPLYAAEMMVPIADRERRVGFLAQERGTNRGVWMPEHHLRAARIIRSFSDYMTPVVTLMDTPGADAGEAANRGNQAHSISKLITEMARLHVPIVGIILGIGYSGGAIPLATSNVLLSVRDGVFNTIQPRGLANIARRYNLSWQECAKSVGVSPYELYKLGYVHGIIDYVPGEEGTQLENLARAITSSILAVERLAMYFVKSRDEVFEHYKRSMNRFLSPSRTLKDIQARGALMTLHSPTHQMNVFGVAYRYLRYLGLRQRVSYTTVESYGRLSSRQVPHGDLAERIEAEHRSAFAKWCDASLNIRYDEVLARSWRHFKDASKALSAARGRVATFFLGSRQESYENAKEELQLEFGFHLYNLWKEGAQYNFLALIQLLSTATWQRDESSDDYRVVDVVSHPEVREDFLSECENFLIFDLLYDRIITNLKSIAGEAKDTNVVSQEAVARLLDDSLTTAIHELVAKNRSEVDSKDEVARRFHRQFSSWIHRFVHFRRRGVLLQSVAEWKRVAFPRVAEPLFAIVTFFLDHLVPSYFQSVIAGRSYDGRINPRNIGVKDFWNRVDMAYRDLLLQEILQRVKKTSAITPEMVLQRFFSDVRELNSSMMGADPVNFPGFRISIEDALSAGTVPCGTVTALARFRHGRVDRRVGVVVSNLQFQAGSFDMASGVKFAKLLVACAAQRLPVICFISSGGMQTKEGAGALFSMAIVNDRITRFVRDNDLPVICFGFGDCTGGAQASLVTHPLAWTYYFSGANMPFAGQIVVPAHLPLSSTLSNYLSVVAGAMNGLIEHPFAPELDAELREVDPTIPVAEDTVEEVIARILEGAWRERASSARPQEVPQRAVRRSVEKTLIHARGCTAVKLVRTAQKRGIHVVLVQSDPDMDSVPAAMLRDADTLVCLGGNTPDESYLNAHSVIRIAEREGVDALHPGIGFLAENADFARLCAAHGINFVGPTVHSMEMMGNKSNAIQTALRLGIPVVPGSHGIITDPLAAAELAASIGYPVIIKAVHGGGGKGIRVVEDPADFKSAFLQITAEAKSAFGNGDCYIEKYVAALRHVEIQILKDSLGHCVVLGLRDCSVQRNKQKILEESGSTVLPSERVAAMFRFAEALANEVNYLGAGTVEFIFDVETDEVYFMEMNTRLQVEHPVTELVTGVDIVGAQFDIASGQSIAELVPESRGYAIEARINAERIEMNEDGGLDFIPDPGTLTGCDFPQQDGVEVISAVAEGSVISPYYDNLVAQVIAHDEDRPSAIRKLERYLGSVTIEGLATNIPLLRRVLTDRVFLGGVYTTNYLPEFFARSELATLIEEARAASGGRGGLAEEVISIEGSDELRVIAPSTGIFYLAASPSEPDFVSVGDRISVDHTLCLIEAMKLFRSISLNSFNQGGELYPGDRSYEIIRINPHSGQTVNEGDLLFVVKPRAAA